MVERPLGVTIIAWINLLGYLFIGISSILYIFSLGASIILLIIFFATLIIMPFSAGYGLLKLSKWGLFLEFAINILGIAFGVFLMVESFFTFQELQGILQWNFKDFILSVSFYSIPVIFGIVSFFYLFTKKNIFK